MMRSIVSGDSLDFLIQSQGYPADAGWALTIRMVPDTAGAAAVELLGVGDGDRYRISASPQQTSLWAPGAYAWAAWVARDGERSTLERGRILVSHNPATMVAGTDLRSETEKALAAVQARLRGQATAGVLEYTIAGRQVRNYSLLDLVKLEARLKSELNAERLASGLPGGGGGIRRILIRTQ